MLTVSGVFSSIFGALKNGKGSVGRGRAYVRLMQCIADNNSQFTAEDNILNYFTNAADRASAYHNIDRIMYRFLKTGKSYPYSMISLTGVRDSIGDMAKYSNILDDIEAACSSLFDERKLTILCAELIELILSDPSVSTVLYGAELVPKRIFEYKVHRPRKVCVEALLLAAIYHAHLRQSTDIPDEVNAGTSGLFVTRYDPNAPFGELFNTEMSADMDSVLTINSAELNRFDAELEYEFEIDLDGENTFIFGMDGAGKTTLLRKMAAENSRSIFLSLNEYRTILLDDYSDKSVYILTAILMKYFYKNTFRSIDTLIAAEGRETFLSRLFELDSFLRSENNFILFLDSVNEIPYNELTSFFGELEYLLSNWNVRVIISGTYVPEHKVFGSLKKAELRGILPNNKVADIAGADRYLKLPLLLKEFRHKKSDLTLNTLGEILDLYINTISARMNDAGRFALCYVMPTVAYETTKHTNAVLRTMIEQSAERALEIYLRNDSVFKNYLAPKGYDRQAILSSLEKSDFTDIILDRFGFLTRDSRHFQNLVFRDDTFRDYFAARYIVNNLEAVKYSCADYTELEKLFGMLKLDDMWFGEYNSEVPWRSDYIYRMIGEICGDYVNIPDENYVHFDTLLDDVLDWAREFYAPRAVQAVITVMRIIRGGIICNTYFARLTFTLQSIPDGIKFSNNGEDPCDFSESTIYIIDDPDAPENHNALLNCCFDNCELIFEDDPDKIRKMGGIIEEYTLGSFL